jgi:hypothetical protein
VGPRSLQRSVRAGFGHRLSGVSFNLSNGSVNSANNPQTIPTFPFETRSPKPEARSPKQTLGNVLLCKTRPLCHLRACTRTSTISLFSLASFPRRPSASQAVPGGATDPTTDNRYADIYIFRQYEFVSPDAIDNDCIHDCVPAPPAVPYGLC